MMADLQDLEFQDFAHDAKVSDVQRKSDLEGDVYEFHHVDQDRENLLQEEGAENANQKRFSIWSFEYYQQYFDVDTDQVLRRVLYSIFPKLGSNFITDHIRPLPDLYGPFWICVTLVFTTAICGNLANYIATGGQTGHWQYNFHIVTMAASAIFGYVFFIPLFLYTFLWYRRSTIGYSYLELLTAYGYSLAVFVPVSILWVFQGEIFRWVIIIFAVLLSGMVLVLSVWPAVERDQKLVSILVVVSILALHSLLAVGFKEYFFDAGGASVLSDSGLQSKLNSLPALTKAGPSPDAKPTVKRINGTTVQSSGKPKRNIDKPLEINVNKEKVIESKKNI